VDTEAFIDAFLEALKLHAGRYEGRADPSKLSATIAKARQEALRMRIATGEIEDNPSKAPERAKGGRARAKSL
jgi:hypothetical protein